MDRLIQSSREQVVDWLRIRVASGVYKEGDRIVERPLTDELGVGRGPIRDALLELTKEGLLVSKPYCGVRVAPKPSPQTAQMLVRLRREIETHALMRGFPRIDDAVKAGWEAHLDRFQFVCSKGDLSAVVKEDMSFHRSIVLLDEEDHLQPVWVPVVSRMRLPYSRHQTLLESHAEHQRIIEALLSGDLAGAITALVDNIQS